ncbi:MAG: hypothetical protein M3440_06200, partial [Chloroflexota bacterium]|nr:hypothetical protein [Chloroflexota bacterium]
MQRTLGDPGTFFPDVDYVDALTLYADRRLAAAWLADQLAARAINQPTSFTATGDLSVSWADRAKGWERLAIRLRQQVAAESTGGFGFAEPDR